MLSCCLMISFHLDCIAGSINTILSSVNCSLDKNLMWPHPPLLRSITVMYLTFLRPVSILLIRLSTTCMPSWIRSNRTFSTSLPIFDPSLSSSSLYSFLSLSESVTSCYSQLTDPNALEILLAKHLMYPILLSPLLGMGPHYLLIHRPYFVKPRFIRSLL